MKRQCWILFLVMPVFLFASKIQISRLSFEKNFIYLSLDTDVHDVINLKQVIDQGIPIDLDYQICLYRKDVGFFGNTEETNFLIHYQIKQDMINSGYEITGNIGDHSVGKWYSQEKDALDFLLTLRKIRIIPSEMLKSDVIYYFEISQKITSIRLAPPLSWLYQILGTWNYDSPKIRSRMFTLNGILME